MILLHLILLNLPWGRPHEKGKALGMGLVACGLYVNTMAAATLSSGDEEIENPLQLQLALLSNENNSS